MPFFPPWDEDELPTTTEDLADMVMYAYREGIKVGRKQGAEEICNRVDDWVQKRYYSTKVVRGSQFAKDILDLANKLVNGLLHGDLGKVPELQEVDGAKHINKWEK